MPSPDDLDRLFAAAERGGEDRAFLDRAARELLEQRLRLADLERLVDRRRLEAVETARKVQRLRNQGLPRRAIVARLGISASQYQRACQANSSRLR